jgi:hypothetical protein
MGGKDWLGERRIGAAIGVAVHEAGAGEGVRPPAGAERVAFAGGGEGLDVDAGGEAFGESADDRPGAAAAAGDERRGGVEVAAHRAPAQ